MKSDIDATQLRAMRENAGLSQWKVAVAVGRTQAWLCCIEMGYVRVAPEVALKIATAIKSLDSRPSTAGKQVEEIA